MAHRSSSLGATRRRSESWQEQEDLACRAVPGARREEGVAHGVLDVAVPEPVLDETEVGAGLEQVGGDAMLEAMEVPLGWRQVGRLPVLLHQPVECAPRDRVAAVAREQDRRWCSPPTEDSPERLRLV